MTNQFAESAPKFSPDGRWLAYESNETGRTEIYVRAFPAAATGWQVADLQQRRRSPGLVAEWPRALVPVRRSDHVGGVHNDEQRVLRREATGVAHVNGRSAGV